MILVTQWCSYNISFALPTSSWSSSSFNVISRSILLERQREVPKRVDSWESWWPPTAVQIAIFPGRGSFTEQRAQTRGRDRGTKMPSTTAASSSTTAVKISRSTQISSGLQRQKWMLFNGMIFLTIVYCSLCWLLEDSVSWVGTEQPDIVCRTSRSDELLLSYFGFWCLFGCLLYHVFFGYNSHPQK